MPAVSIIEVNTGRTGSDSNSLDRSYKRVFQVEMDSTRADPPEVLAASAPPFGALPALYSFYTPGDDPDLWDPDSWCHDRTATVKQNSRFWEVVCSYSTKLDRPDLNAQVSPELRPSEIEFDTITVGVPLLYDVNGLPILNSAGDLFDPPLEMEETRMLIRITRNVAFGGFDPDFYARFQNTVNSTAFFGLKIWQVKCRKVRSVRFFEDGTYFYRITGEFEVSYRTAPVTTIWPNEVDPLEETDTVSLAWMRYVLDRGFREIKKFPPDPSVIAGIRGVITDPVTKRPLTTAGLLDGAGYHLLPGDAPVFLGFRVFPQADFDEMNLIVE